MADKKHKSYRERVRDEHIIDELHRLFPSKTGNVLSSLQINPKGVKFATQDKGESVYILTRAALITNFGWMFRTFLAILIGLALQPILFYLGIRFDSILSERPFLQITIIFVYFAILFGYTLDSFLKWFFNIYIVTDKRILDYDYAAYQNYKISEASLLNIEDVTQKQVGIFPILFKYGNITIQTAAEKMQFHFDKVPNPSYLRDKIMDLADLLREELSDDTNS